MADMFSCVLYTNYVIHGGEHFAGALSLWVVLLAGHLHD
jgi:hypothetical protein